MDVTSSQREQLRLRRETARAMRERASDPENSLRIALLRLANDVDREADHLERDSPRTSPVRVGS
jgi:hypothetical protein